MPNDPAIKTSEHTPIVSALLGLPGVTQIGHALGLTGAAPSSEPVPHSASKVVESNQVHKFNAQSRIAGLRAQRAFSSQTSASRNTFDGGASGRENSPGAMAPSTKASISVIAIGETTGETYTDFILSNVIEQDAEKIEVVETFGAFHLFASGRFARKYQFSGHLRAHPVNHAAVGGSRGTGYAEYNVPAAVKLRNLYETYLRATVQAVRQTFTRITVDRDSYDGWITTLNLGRDSQTEFLTSFTFTMVAYRRTHEKDGSAQALLRKFDGTAGVQKKPIARLKAEQAAAVGACVPAWYINDTKATVLPVVEISESDAGLSKLIGQHITLRSESGGSTAVGGTCTLTAKVDGNSVELTDIGIATSLFNLTTAQLVFTQNVVFRKLFDLAAGKASIPIEVTAAGISAEGAPLNVVFTIPIKVAGVAQTRVSGYEVRTVGKPPTPPLATLVFPVDANQPSKYASVSNDTVSIVNAQFNPSGPTEFQFEVTPLCVDAKTGISVSPPPTLRINLSLLDYPDHNVSFNSAALVGGKNVLGYKYLVDLLVPGNTDEYQKKGASAVEFAIDVPAQDGIELAPRASMRFAFPTLVAPFPLVSEFRSGLRSSASDPIVISVLLAVKSGITAATAVALASKVSFTAEPGTNIVHLAVTPQAGSIAYTSASASVSLGVPVITSFIGPSDILFIKITSTSVGRVDVSFVPPKTYGVTAILPLGVPAPPVIDSAIFLFDAAWAVAPQ